VTSLRDFGDVEDLANLMPPLLAGSPGDPKKLMALHFAFGELCDNAATHSGSSPFFVAAQRYTGRTSSGAPRLELAVADAGIGIPGHLRRNERYSDIQPDEDLIALAFRPGVTGTRDRRGYGLFDVVRETGEVAQGEMIVHSGSGSAFIPFGSGTRRRRFRPLQAQLPGTWIQVRIWE
jgi:hypothetical protein